MTASEMPENTDALLGGLRDTLRSAKRWQELLSPASRRQMLADIATIALAIGRDLYPQHSLSDLDAGDADEFPNDICPRERLAFLISVWPQMAGALRQIEASPQTVLRPEKRYVPVERARRVSPKDIVEALRLSVRRNDRPLSWQETPIGETYLTPCADTPANRSVKAILVAWARDLADIATLADICEAPGVAREAERLRLRVRQTLRRDPWRTLPLSPAPAPLPASLRTNGAYRLVHDTYRRYRRGFALDWSNPLFTLPSRETWLLYEYWGLLKVAGILRELGFQATSPRGISSSEGNGFALSRGGLTFTLAKGHAARLVFQNMERGKIVTLTYSREFARASSSEAPGWHSRSHALRPDITLEYAGRLLLLDPKFKTYGYPTWETNDIRQMHSYRDAIRSGDEARVEAAWLLYCGRNDTANRSIIAYPTASETNPFGNGDVGALLLRPNVNNSHINDLIVQFLSSDCPLGKEKHG